MVISRGLQEHPLVTFWVLAFAVTWVVWVPRAVGVPMGVVGEAWTWAPAVAAMIAAAITGGREALRQLLGRLLRWRVPWYWYVLVGVGPAAFSLGLAGVYVLLGGTWSIVAPRALQAPAILPVLLLVLSATDGLGEELAWRGYALPRLLARHSALVASMILGFLWALWHLPLLWTAGIADQQLPLWLLLLDISAKAIVFTWIFLRTRGSVLIVVLLHGSTNLFTVSPAQAITSDLMFPLLATAAKWLLVLPLVAVAGSRLTRCPDSEAILDQNAARSIR